MKVFENCGFSITVTFNITSEDFLHVNFDLKTESYKLFGKPNNNLKFIDIDSNHPPQFFKQAYLLAYDYPKI